MESHRKVFRYIRPESDVLCVPRHLKATALSEQDRQNRDTLGRGANFRTTILKNFPHPRPNQSAPGGWGMWKSPWIP